MPNSVSFIKPDLPATLYPSEPVEITDFRYDSALLLMRLEDAVEMRQNSDAHYIVAADFHVSWQEVGRMERTHLKVPRGMLTDLTSVPVLFRGLVNRVGPWLEASIVHDFLCIAWRTMDGDGSPLRRKFADDVMWAAMCRAQVGVRRRLIYAAVRGYAWIGYPQRCDPAADHRLYINLDSTFVSDQLPPGTRL